MVSLSKLPDAPKEYQISFGGLYGGLNTSRLPHEIGSAQLSDCINVYWKDGAIRSRHGQESLEAYNQSVWHLQEEPIPETVIPLAMYDRVWHDRIFMAFTEEENEIGYLATYNVVTKQYQKIYTIEESESQIVEWSKKSRGSFFVFADNLYYKNRNLYLQIEYVEGEHGNDSITAETVTPYTPITQINTNKNGIGDLYQPENRISPYKEIWYNADNGIEYTEIACDGVTKEFHLPYKKAAQIQDGDLQDVLEVYIGAALGVEGTDYSVNLAAGTVTTLATDAPAIGLKLSVKMQLQSFIYRLPVAADTQPTVEVKNLSTMEYEQIHYVSSAPEWTTGHHEFTTDSLNNPTMIIFAANFVEQFAGYDSNVLNSFIKVTYSKANQNANESINKCNIATVFGATGIETNCVVFSGCPAQPNAIFWSGNDSNGANPTYFPMTQYNIIGEYSDPITAFGRQQNRLVVLQRNRVSAAEFGYATVDGRLTVSMNIRSINDRIGCDMPQSVQLCNNNLVWAHSRYGVLYLKDSTYAYETLIACISENVNEHSKVVDRDGLLAHLRGNPYDVTSLDDGERYWLTVGNYTYVWDYTTQPYTSNTQKLCWWLMSGINAAAWALDVDKMYALSRDNIVTDEETEEDISDCWLFTFGDEYKDFGETVHRGMQLQSQTFGTYDRLKNVMKMIVSVDSERRSHAKIKYLTDYEEREDLTDINTLIRPTRHGYNRPDAIHVRKPKCLHIHTFAVRFDTDSAYDLNLISCQIFYIYRSRTKAGLRI